MNQPRPIKAETVAELARAGSLRTVLVVRAGEKWAVEVDVGMERRPMCSQRAAVRLWASLDTLARFLKRDIGVARFEVHS